MLVKKAEDAERKRQYSDLHLLYELERKLEQSALQKIGKKSQNGFEALDQYRLTSLERLGRKKVILVATCALPTTVSSPRQNKTGSSFT